jgi:hypothetical protein
MDDADIQPRRLPDDSAISPAIVAGTSSGGHKAG